MNHSFGGNGSSILKKKYKLANKATKQVVLKALGFHYDILIL